jgi:hypothetical protein
VDFRTLWTFGRYDVKDPAGITLAWLSIIYVFSNKSDSRTIVQFKRVPRLRRYEEILSIEFISELLDSSGSYIPMGTPTDCRCVNGKLNKVTCIQLLRELMGVRLSMVT